MTAVEPLPEPPSFLRTFIPTLLFMLLCGIVGPIFLIAGLTVDGPGTGWLLPWGVAITVIDVVIAVFVARIRTRQRRTAHRLRTSGRRGHAEIISLDPTNVTINDQPLMSLRLRIHGDDMTPFEVEDKMVIPTYRLPFLAGEVPVLVDPGTHEWEFDWDSARLRGASPAAAVEESPAERLAELDDLLGKDLISRDEYDATRARILDEI
ncbi:SHOCT domain-containing protein [Nocardioides caeni]|uniref:SHOCT domain-containing protein n=1 Tax=Nocardioides caeni TaxID=574700 RepID=A0A4S8N6N6_9ACTN|nr:SHOCT domain-containing protein [Nocardioides caeni]THV11261.1 SHOCT domain-containing protein [Nocardioides caeni]